MILYIYMSIKMVVAGGPGGARPLADTQPRLPAGARRGRSREI